MGASITNHIVELQDSIYYMNIQIDQQQVALERLQTARTELIDYQNEIHQKENNCHAPDLPKSSWYGSLAKEFDTLRSNNLQPAYRTIPYKQLDGIILIIEGKIKETQQVIDNFHIQISSAQSMVEDLTRLNFAGERS